MILKTILYIMNYYSLEKLNTIFNFAMSMIEKKGEEYITYHKRPKVADKVTSFSDKVNELPKLGLVLQGPVIKEDDFTLETIKIYKKHFNNTNIILSTWSDEDKNYLEKIKKEDIEIVLCEKPEYFGISNVNLQIMSSKMGLRRAKELNCEYAIKSRTDQRIYAPNIKEFLFNLIQTYPLKENINKQKQRLVGTSFCSFKYRLYCISDMFLFGNIEDMLLYWDIELDDRPLNILDNINNNIKNWSSCRVCEVYFVTEFLKKLGIKLNYTLKDSWQICADHFCIIDQDSLDLYWPKYEKNKEFRFLKYNINTAQELNFREWFNLYTGLKNKQTIPEYILELEFKEEIKGK